MIDETKRVTGGATAPFAPLPEDAPARLNTLRPTGGCWWGESPAREKKGSGLLENVFEKFLSESRIRRDFPASM